jgi:hypothetical protein
MTKAKNADQIISFEDSADLIAESQVENRLDLGHSYVYRLKHPVKGSIIVMNCSSGACAVLTA